MDKSDTVTGANRFGKFRDKFNKFGDKVSNNVTDKITDKIICSFINQGYTLKDILILVIIFNSIVEVSLLSHFIVYTFILISYKFEKRTNKVRPDLQLTIREDNV